MTPLYRPATPSAPYKVCKVATGFPNMLYCSLQTIMTLATSNGWEASTAPTAKPASIAHESLPTLLGMNAVASKAFLLRAAV